MLSHLAHHISRIFEEDHTCPRHEDLSVSIYCRSEYGSCCYLKSGDLFTSPFASTRLGVFAVIQSSLMQLAPHWPAMAMIPIVPSLQEPGVPHDANPVFCITEGALVVWSTSIDGILSLCVEVRNEILAAKLAAFTNGSQSPSTYKSHCAPVKQNVDDQTWDTLLDLDRLIGLSSIGEPFLGDWVAPHSPDCAIFVSPSDPVDQEPELDSGLSDIDVALTSTTSSLSLTPPSPSLSSRFSSTPPLSPNFTPKRSPGDRYEYEADERISSASSFHLSEDQNCRLPTPTATTVRPRDVNFDQTMEAVEDEEVEEADKCIDDAFSQLEPSFNMQGSETPSTPDSLENLCLSESSPVTRPNQSHFVTLAGKTRTRKWTTDNRSVRRSRRIAIANMPYPTAANPFSSPSQTPSPPSLPSETNTPPIIDEDYHPGTEDHSDALNKPRRQHKRKKAAKLRFPCRFCPESFTRDADADRHMKSCPENPTREEKKRCGYCSKGLPVRDDAKDRHWRSGSCTAAAKRRGIAPGTCDFFS